MSDSCVAGAWVWAGTITSGTGRLDWNSPVGGAGGPGGSVVGGEAGGPGGSVVGTAPAGGGLVVDVVPAGGTVVTVGDPGGAVVLVVDVAETVGGTVVVDETRDAGATVVVELGGTVTGSWPEQGIVVAVDPDPGAVVDVELVGVVVIVVTEPGTVVDADEVQGAVVVVVGASEAGRVVAVVVGDGGAVEVGETPLPGRVVVVVGWAVVVVVVVGATRAGGSVDVVVGATVDVGVSRLVNVASVTPGPIRTTTVAPPRLGAPTARAAGETLMADTSRPRGRTSETTTFVATGNDPATAQKPPGAGPAGTDTAVAPTAKLKLEPTATPSPATLQILSGLTSAWLVKVTVVWVETSPATMVTWAVRATRSRVTRRSGGTARTSVTEMPSTATSVTVAGPTGSSRAAEQAPTGTDTERLPTVNVYEPVTEALSDCLQISRIPVVSPWPSTITGVARKTSTNATAPTSVRALFRCTQLKAPALTMLVLRQDRRHAYRSPDPANTCRMMPLLQAPMGGAEPSIGDHMARRHRPRIGPKYAHTEPVHFLRLPEAGRTRPVLRRPHVGSRQAQGRLREIRRSKAVANPRPQLSTEPYRRPTADSQRPSRSGGAIAERPRTRRSPRQYRPVTGRRIGTIRRRRERRPTWPAAWFARVPSPLPPGAGWRWPPARRRAIPRLPAAGTDRPVRWRPGWQPRP